MKEWPEDQHETVDFDELCEPLRKLLKDNYNRKPGKLKLPESFNKFYNIGRHNLATTPPVDDTLTPDGLQYHRERGRDLLSVVIGIAIQYGIEQGRRITLDNLQFKLKSGELFEKLYYELLAKK